MTLTNVSRERLTREVGLLNINIVMSGQRVLMRVHLCRLSLRHLLLNRLECELFRLLMSPSSEVDHLNLSDGAVVNVTACEALISLRAI